MHSLKMKTEETLYVGAQPLTFNTGFMALLRRLSNIRETSLNFLTKKGPLNL
jgi:hypothetical protein